MVTLSRYSHSLFEHKAEMMNKIGSFLDEKNIVLNKKNES